MGDKITSMGYKQLLDDIQFLLDKARARAYQAVDNIRVQTYWQMGERIAREELKHKGRAIYSRKVIKKLAADLGFSRVILYRIIQLYKTYPIVSALPRQLSWTHLVELLSVVDSDERQFYEAHAIRNGWSSRELRDKIKANLYSKRMKELLPREASILTPYAPEEVFKNIYDFDFLNLSRVENEKDLEKSLILNIEKVLLEFGTDFSLSGRQRKMLIDRQIHAIDLEFYHRGIPCVVLIDLKIGKFKSEYIGNMNKYLNYYRENKLYPWEKDPVGLIICEDRGREEAHYALGNLTNRIFVAEYKVKLPSEKDIVEKLRKL